MYENLDEVMKPADVLNVILNTDVTSDIVCLQKPVGVKDAAVFLVNTTKLRHLFPYFPFLVLSIPPQVCTPVNSRK